MSKSNMAGAGAWKDKGVVSFLAGAKPDAIVHIPAPCEAGKPKVETKDFHFTKCIDWGMAKGQEALATQMGNRVRKCEKCGKPNAFTLTICNSCGAQLPKETTTTPNVFMCFAYGFEGLKLSLRFQDDNMLVLDDMLSLSPCHFNALWTKDWIPDFRWLLTRPKEGLRVLTTMKKNCDSALQEQFECNAEYKAKITSGGDLKDNVVSGLNFPPSQFQLHLQYIAVPMLPFQFAQYLNNVHYTKGRFFPVEYVLEALKMLVAKGQYIDVQEDTTGEQIIKCLDAMGVSYDKIYDAVFASVADKQRKFGKWEPKSFDKLVVDNKLYDFKVGDDGVPVPIGEPQDGEVAKQVDLDKATLQNYGRPYNEGKPNAISWYKFAKEPGTVSRIDKAFPAEGQAVHPAGQAF